MERPGRARRDADRRRVEACEPRALWIGTVDEPRLAADDRDVRIEVDLEVVARTDGERSVHIQLAAVAHRAQGERCLRGHGAVWIAAQLELEPEAPCALQRSPIADLAIIEVTRTPVQLDARFPEALARAGDIPLIARWLGESVEVAAAEDLDPRAGFEHRTDRPRGVRFEVELHTVDVRALEVAEIVDDKPPRVAGIREVAAEPAAFLRDPQLAADAAIA